MKKLLYIFAVVAFTLVSCNDHEFNFNNHAISESSTGLIIKKVRKLENPYSVSNMKKAYSALKQEGLMKAALDIEATHLYVRFYQKIVQSWKQCSVTLHLHYSRILLITSSQREKSILTLH